MKQDSNIFKFDDAFPDGVFIVPGKCRYNMRKAIEQYRELGRELTEEEMEEFILEE